MTVNTPPIPAQSLYSIPFLSPYQLPERLIDEVAPGLFQGGTPDDDWRPTHEINLALQPSRDAAMEASIDAVVTLFARATPWGSGVMELRYGFPDARPSAATLEQVVEAARWAHRRWTSGERVLIRCQAGLNRSGLVTALVLMMEGSSVAEAIAAIRSARAGVALCNTHFVDWLVADAAQLLPGDRETAVAVGNAA